MVGCSLTPYKNDQQNRVVAIYHYTCILLDGQKMNITFFPIALSLSLSLSLSLPLSLSLLEMWKWISSVGQGTQRQTRRKYYSMTQFT